MQCASQPMRSQTYTVLPMLPEARCMSLGDQVTESTVFLYSSLPFATYKLWCFPDLNGRVPTCGGDVAAIGGPGDGPSGTEMTEIFVDGTSRGAVPDLYGAVNAC